MLIKIILVCSCAVHDCELVHGNARYDEKRHVERPYE